MAIKNKHNNVVLNLLRNASGNIDTVATMASWQNELAKVEASENHHGSVISKAVEKAFNDLPEGKYAMTMDGLVSQALRQIPNSGDDFPTYSEKVKNFVRLNTQEYALTRGAGGGVVQLSRLNDEQRAKVE